MNPIKKLAFPLLLIAMCLAALVGATTILDPNYVYTSGSLNGTSAQILGPLTCTTLDTGQGSYELYAMNQNLRTTDAPTFATVNTGQGANELYDMNQNVQTTDAVTFTTVNTGQGANELYDMDQNVMTTSDVTFNSVSFTELGSSIGAEATYYIDRSGADSRLIQGTNREALAVSTAYNVWRWAIGNLSASGGKIIFSGDHNIGANQLSVDGPGGWLGSDIVIEGLGRGISILRRTGNGNLIHIVTGTNLRIRYSSLRTTNGTVIYGQPSMSNFEQLELTCGNWLDDGWAIHIINGEQCEVGNLFIQSYGEGCVWFQTNATTYDFGNTDISGHNMWWMYSPGAIGLKLTGWLNGANVMSCENIHVGGKISILASPGATLANNYTGVYMYYGWNNQILNLKVERCATAYLLRQSRYNVIDLMYRSSTYLNGMTIFDLSDTSNNNHILHYNVQYRGTTNIHLINDTSSTLNNPNVFEAFTFGSITAPGEWYANINDYTVILWMGGDTNSENLYGQNAGVNYNFPTTSTTYHFEHHCARAPATVFITWNEQVVEDWWVTTNSTDIIITLGDASEQVYTFDWACSINKQGIG